MRRIVITLLFSLALACLTTSGKDAHDSQYLRGLKGVSIRVQVFTGDENTNSSWAYQVRNDVELRLRRAGVPIIEADEPKLAVTILCQRSKECGLYAADASVSLLQRARLQRDPTLNVMSSTWTQSGIYVFGENNFRYVREEIQDTVDKFANDYLTANPK
jgi:hypothetical protein